MARCSQNDTPRGDLVAAPATVLPAEIPVAQLWACTLCGLRWFRDPHEDYGDHKSFVKCPHCQELAAHIYYYERAKAWERAAPGVKLLNDIIAGIEALFDVMPERSAAANFIVRQLFSFQGHLQEAVKFSEEARDFPSLPDWRKKNPDPS